MSGHHAVGDITQRASEVPIGDIVDRTDPCQECGTLFILTSMEQLYYRERGYRDPGRCPACRGRGRAERNGPLLAAHQVGDTEPTSEAVYGGGSVHDHRKARAVMYPAICASCGKETQVPFPPRGNRPVYCRDCFAQRRGRR